MLSAVIFWAFTGWVVIQLLYVPLFLRFFSLPSETRVIALDKRKPVSVVICAKDEAVNLGKNLETILQQEYSDADGNNLYEVVVVNDCSTDSSHQLLTALSLKYPHLREVIITPDMPRNVAGKKFALSTGVASARYDWILLTDADCQAASEDWLALMAGPLSEGKEIVAGYPAHAHYPGLLNKFIRWETTHTFLQLSTYAMAGMPYLAIGRNLACTREVCLKTYTSPQWTQVPTGDDDLLVKLNATPHNLTLIIDPRAYTYSSTKETLGAWMRQKERHTSDGKYYKGSIKTLLALYGISQAAVWVYFFCYLLFTHYMAVAACMLFVRCVIYWLLWAAAGRRLKEKNIIYYLPLFDIAWMLYNFAFLPYILRKNKQHWT